MNKIKRNIDIIIILLIGFVLRFTVSITHSYSNDELSAINRLQYDQFSELIEYGVKTGDMHPAGVQVFMKAWSAVAGVSEAAMRFPFVICGVLSVLMIFMIGNKWVNRQTGIIAAILLSFLYFPIMNAEFARPYSPGLLFSLLTAWFYLKILFDKQVNFKLAIFLGLSVAGAMYMHHFAFLFVGWLCVSGFIFIKLNKLKFMLIAAGIAILLYLPHIPITNYQLSVGGLQWLGSPDADWLGKFIFYAFNESWWLLGLLLLLIIVTYFLKDNEEYSEGKSIILFGVWFFGIYAIGHIYSLLSTPVLKFPVMLFAFPFLLLLIGTWLSNFKYQGVLSAVLIIFTSVSTIQEKDLYGHMHYELFKEVSDDILKWENEYGAENIYTIYNLNNPNYMNFYANQQGKEIQFDWDVVEFGDAANIRGDLLKIKDEKPYCIVGYSGRLTLPQVFETCKEFYPNILAYKKYNNSAVFLLTKIGKKSLKQNNAILSSFYPGDTNKDWIYNNQLVVEDSLYSIRLHGRKQYTYVLNEMNPYGPDFSFELARIQNPYNKYIKVEVVARIPEDAQLTATLTVKRNNQPLEHSGEPFWLGRDLERMILTSLDRKGYFVFKIPDFFESTDTLTISLWNRNPVVPVYIENIKIRVFDNIWS